MRKEMIFGILEIVIKMAVLILVLAAVSGVIN